MLIQAPFQVQVSERVAFNSLFWAFSSFLSAFNFSFSALHEAPPSPFKAPSGPQVPRSYSRPQYRSESKAPVQVRVQGPSKPFQSPFKTPSSGTSQYLHGALTDPGPNTGPGPGPSLGPGPSPIPGLGEGSLQLPLPASRRLLIM